MRQSKSKRPPAAPLRAMTTAIALLLCLGCEPVGHALEEEVDLLPPVFERIAATGPNSVAVQFDEPVSVTVEAVRIEPPVAVHAVDGGDTADGSGERDGDGTAAAVVIVTEQPFAAGRRYTLHTTAPRPARQHHHLRGRLLGLQPAPARTGHQRVHPARQQAAARRRRAVRGRGRQPRRRDPVRRGGRQLPATAWCCRRSKWRPATTS